MAFALPTLTLDASSSGTGIRLPVVELGTASNTGIRLPTLVMDASTVVQGLRMPLMGLTEAAASTLTLTATGGGEITGAAFIESTLNGVYSVDPYVVVSTGGAEGSGSADVVANLVTIYADVTMQGGAKITGAATVVYATSFMQGGAVGTGSASVVTFTNDRGVNDVEISLNGPTVAGFIPFEVSAAINANAQLVASGYAQAVAVAAGAVSIRAPSAAGKTAGVSVDGAIVLRAPLAIGQSYSTVEASGVLPLSAPLAAGKVAMPIAADGAIQLGAPVILTSVSLEVTQAFVVVTNLLSKAITFYEAYPYNSFAQIGTTYFGAGNTGLFKLDIGDKDVTVSGSNDIDALVRYGVSDFGSDKQKRVTDCYVGMRSDGDMTLRVYIDEQDPIEYTVSPHDIARLKERRSFIGKGARGKYWQLELANTAGCSFDLDAIDIAAVPTDRRI